MIDIIAYENKYQPDFKRLNLEWLDKYGLTESHDLEMLDDPQESVLARGGYLLGYGWRQSNWLSRVI